MMMMEGVDSVAVRVDVEEGDVLALSPVREM